VFTKFLQKKKNQYVIGGSFFLIISVTIAIYMRNQLNWIIGIIIFLSAGISLLTFMEAWRVHKDK